MEEKERFELFGEHCIKDNNPDARCQLLDTYKACVLLNEQYKENEQLKQRLAEKEKIEYTDTINFVETSEPDIVAKELDRLNEQLAEKDKEIERLKMYDEYRFELPYPKVKILGKTFEDIQELIDKWIKQGSKDKISFAVEQLEKVKRTFIDVAWEDVDFAIEIIDNQIKELKGENDD